MFPRFPWLWGQRVTSRVDTSDGSHRTEPTGRHQIKSNHITSHLSPASPPDREPDTRGQTVIRCSQYPAISARRTLIRPLHACSSVETTLLVLAAERVQSLQSPRRPRELPALLSPLQWPLRGNVCRCVAVTSSDRTCHLALTPSPYHPSECERG